MVLMAQRSSLYDGPDLGPCPFTLTVHSDDGTVEKILDALRHWIADDEAGQDVDLDDVRPGHPDGRGDPTVPVPSVGHADPYPGEHRILLHGGFQGARAVLQPTSAPVSVV